MRRLTLTIYRKDLPNFCFTLLIVDLCFENIKISSTYDMTIISSFLTAQSVLLTSSRSVFLKLCAVKSAQIHATSFSPYKRRANFMTFLLLYFSSWTYFWPLHKYGTIQLFVVETILDIIILRIPVARFGYAYDQFDDEEIRDREIKFFIIFRFVNLTDSELCILFADFTLVITLALQRNLIVKHVFSKAFQWPFSSLI